jgi:hypothetical protein
MPSQSSCQSVSTRGRGGREMDADARQELALGYATVQIDNTGQDERGFISRSSFVAGAAMQCPQR